MVYYSINLFIYIHNKDASVKKYTKAAIQEWEIKNFSEFEELDI
jgi:hypothetical protein